MNFEIKYRLNISKFNKYIPSHIKKINIIPSRFLEWADDGAIVRCLMDDNSFEDRFFEKILLGNIINPKYLFIGIIIGTGFTQINVVDANEFEELFKEKYTSLSEIITEQ